MKKLALLFVLISFDSFSQTSSSNLVYIGNAVSYSENKELSQYVFNYFNDYRNSIGLDDFVWNETIYQSATKWNVILAKNNLYGHSASAGTLYNYSSTNDYEIINGTITNESYNATINQKQCIADSMLRSFLRSPYHEPVLCSEVKTKTQEYSKIKKDVWGGQYLKLAKYAAVSVVVKNMGHYTQYTLIMHLYINEL